MTNRVSITLTELDQQSLEAMQRRNPKSDPVGILGDVPPTRVPRHVAIIMDGNGRWATKRGLPRMAGHRAGAKVVRGVIDHAGRLGTEFITLYSFSLENWKRPKDEVDALMHLYLEYMDAQKPEFMKENIRFVQIGRTEGLPAACVAKRDEVMELTANNKAGTLVLAVNYGSRDEITQAAQRLAARCVKGELVATDITADDLAGELDTGRQGIPDPDLLIRTAGEMRLSNYLLWQLSYSELYVTEVLWPDFGPEDLEKAVRAFAGRSRTFGAAPPVK
jgi:undecaprenyl diphosphate synthase